MINQVVRSIPKPSPNANWIKWIREDRKDMLKDFHTTQLNPNSNLTFHGETQQSMKYADIQIYIPTRKMKKEQRRTDMQEKRKRQTYQIGMTEFEVNNKKKIIETKEDFRELIKTETTGIINRGPRVKFSNNIKETQL